MDGVQTVALAVLQGLTEFLPISSSAHLVLLPFLFDWPDQGLAFDVAVHVGSLAAVVTYFWGELRELWVGWWGHVNGGHASAESRLAWAIIVATIPVVTLGGLFADWIEASLRDPIPIALATLVFGLLLWVADRSGARRRDEHAITWRDVAIIGVAQALALIPGTSRSGITITAGLWVGLTRTAAARFSFLLSIPVIVLAGGYNAVRLLSSPVPVLWGLIAVGAVVSGVTAYLCIHWFLKLIDQIGLIPFVIYRLILAGVLFYIYL
ncbi:MAG: undecaprenyl-diphosphate phosphatase [Gammaproteobacteria bacterium]|nr:undecaprenyl-diphosphate phosphatase [Gammaproteobacteria bacterium]